jgi:hypothetical protein
VGIVFYLIEEIILPYFYYEVINEDHADIMYSIFLSNTFLKKNRRSFENLLPEIDQRILSFTNNQVVRRGYN